MEKGSRQHLTAPCSLQLLRLGKRVIKRAQAYPGPELGVEGSLLGILTDDLAPAAKESSSSQAAKNLVPAQREGWDPRKAPHPSLGGQRARGYGEVPAPVGPSFLAGH